MTDAPHLRRADLVQLQGMSPRLLAAFEQQSAAVLDATTGVAATQALKDATVIVLSANGDFTNERVLEIGDGIGIEITDDTVKLSVKDVARTQDFGVTLIPPAAVVLFLPSEGTLISDVNLKVSAIFAGLNTYANDAAAAVGGVIIRGAYINSTTGAVQARLT